MDIINSVKSHIWKIQMVTTEEFKKRQLDCIRKAAENCRKMVELNPNWSVPRWFERNQKRMNDIFLAQPPKENECNVWDNGDSSA